MSNEATKANMLEIPLLMEMESLVINECERLNNSLPSTSGESSKKDEPNRRILRKKIQPVREVNKRRVISTPRKCDISNPTNDEIQNLYLCKQFKRVAPNLETIFEEPKLGKNKEEILIGSRKYKRFITFEQSLSQRGKVRKRKSKGKKVIPKTSIKRKRTTMAALLERLKNVE